MAGRTAERLKSCNCACPIRLGNRQYRTERCTQRRRDRVPSDSLQVAMWRTFLSRANLRMPPEPSGKGKSLKDKNRWQIWLILAANSLILYGISQSNTIRVDGLRALFTDANYLLPVGFALTMTTLLNGVLSLQMKNRLVSLRWTSALPGDWGYSHYAKADSRIDFSTEKPE